MSVPSMIVIVIILSCFYKYTKKTAKTVKKKVLKKFPPRVKPTTSYSKDHFEISETMRSQARKSRANSSSNLRRTVPSLPTSLVNDNATFGQEFDHEEPIYDDAENYRQIDLNDPTSKSQDQNLTNTDDQKIKVEVDKHGQDCKDDNDPESTQIV